MLVLTAGCAASTYPLNPQLAAQVGLAEPPSFSERVGRDPDGAGPVVQRGSCSWYGPRFHGRRTSNGEVFDKNALTAAHPTLPFGSEIEVTDVDSGKKVRVRINDRGPFIRGRILDLSYAAAASLDIIHKGTADVQLRLVDVDDAEWSAGVFAVQVATFPKKIDAEHFVENLNARQRTAGLYYVKGPGKDAKEFSVRFGPFPCEQSAKSAASQLKRVGLTPSLMREDMTSAQGKSSIVR
jgi:rare lipoprotein A